jgi:hypothetical protein
MAAADGKGMSGVMVPTTMRSTSSARTPAILRALWAALRARSLDASFSAATWRSLMPVRSTIHWSLVSTILSRSALVRIFSGT